MSKLVEYTDSDSDSDVSMVAGIEKTMDTPALGVGSVVPVNIILQGSEEWQRIGRTVRMLCLRFLFTKEQFPFCVIYDCQPNGVLPAFTTIFAGYNNDGSASGNFMVNPDWIDRFHLLWHSTISLSTKDAILSSVTAETLEVAVSLDHIVQFKSDAIPASGLDISSIASGALYLASTGFSPTNISCYQVRLIYTDV